MVPTLTASLNNQLNNAQNCHKAVGSQLETEATSYITEENTFRERLLTNRIEARKHLHHVTSGALHNGRVCTCQDGATDERITIQNVSKK
jgi:hypothetical protein